MKRGGVYPIVYPCLNKLQTFCSPEHGLDPTMAKQLLCCIMFFGVGNTAEETSDYT